MNRKLQFEYNVLQTLYWLVNLCTTAFIVPILQDQGFSSVQIGTLLGIRALGNVVFQPYLVRLLERQYKPIAINQLIAGLLVCSLVLTALQWVNPPFVIMFLIFIGYGVCTFGISSFIDALYVLYDHQGHHIAYPFARGLGSLSFSVGAYFFGMIASMPLILVLQMVLICLLLVLVLKMHPVYQQHIQDVHAKSNNKDMLKQYPLLLYFLIATALAFIGKEMSGNFLIDAYKSVGGTTGDYGLGISIMAFVELPVAIFFTRFMKRVGIVRLMLISFFFSSVRILLLWLAPNVIWLHIAQVFQMLGAGLFWSGNVQFVRTIIPANYAVRAQALIGVCYLGIASGLGSVLSGWIMQQSDIHILLEVSYIFSLLGACVLFIGTHIQKQNNP